MKILYIGDSPLTSDKANLIQVLYMCNAFSKLGNEVILAVPEDKKNISNKKLIYQKFNKEVEFSVMNYPKVTLKKRFNSIGGYMGVKNMLKKVDVDFCFVRNPAFFNLATQNSIPAIFESHNARLHQKSSVLDIFWRRNLIKNFKFHNSKMFIAISNALAEIWKRRGIPEEKVIVLHDGVEDHGFSKVPERERARKQLKLPLRNKIVLYAGSLYANRGIENIFKLARNFPQVLFLVLGGPEHRKEYHIKRVLKHNIKNVVFKGHIPHFKIRSYLFAADILLMIWTRDVPTINYCSPLKMFEYMAANRIIVGHGFPTIREVLIDGETAYLANPDSFEELSGKLDKALNENYPSKIADNARRLVLKQFTWTIRARSILQGLNPN